MSSVSRRSAIKAIWVVTAYFNWCRFQTKYANYIRFRQHLERAGINLLTVECALFGEPFELGPGENMIQVRTDSVLWQKERLLNIGLGALPRSCEYVAWVDCDLLFENADWSTDAVDLLETHGVVQLFETLVRLPKGRSSLSASDLSDSGFVRGLRDSALERTTPKLGHPGFAWAARRDVLEACGGLYDACIIGGADRVIAHAWLGDYHAAILQEIVRGRMRPHYENWAKQAHRVVRQSVNVVEGMVLHLWHGESADRQYLKRHRAVGAFDFSPLDDITQNSYGCWEWASNKPELHKWVREYFASRREDG